MQRIPSIFLLLALILAAPGLPALAMQPNPEPPTAPASATSDLTVPTSCGYTDTVASLLAQTNINAWTGWIRQLSGADPVTVRGQPYTIHTRSSYAMFHPDPGSRSMAYEFVRETVLGWYPPSQYPDVQIEEDPFQPFASPTTIWKNLIVTIPGTQFPGEIVILSAHLDSTSNERDTNAPGADDNATGSATLLEAARLLQGHPLPRTVRLIWFTGEEQGLTGSWSYVQDHNLTGIKGVINLDMFGYDGDGDRCFELHIGDLNASAVPGSCFVKSIDAYGIDLAHDYITTGATRSSDHAPFWDAGIGALEVLENYFSNNQPEGCVGRDPNPNYHGVNDTISNMTPTFSFDVARAALATAFSLAAQYKLHFPLLMNGSTK